jgi:hypothetical protein
MLLLDSILAAPGKAVVALFQELAKKAQEEFLDDDVVKKELQEIYALVEGGRISDSEFESRESLLLARLEEIARVKFGIAAAQAALPAADGSIIEDGAGEEPAFIEVEEPGLIVQQGMVVRPLTTPPVIAEPEPPRLELLPWSAVEAAAPPEVAAPIAAPAPATLEVAAIPSMFAAPPPAPVFAAPAPATPPVAAIPSAPVFAAPPAVAAPVAAPAPAPVRLNLGQVVEAALGGLSMLKLKVSSVTSVNRAGDGWQVVVEVLERRGVPDTSDLLGVYELHLDEAGNILRYERTRIRRRCDLGR